MTIPKGKIALLDMHNDTAFAVECILRCSKDGTPMATVQAIPRWLPRDGNRRTESYLRTAPGSDKSVSEFNYLKLYD